MDGPIYTCGQDGLRCEDPTCLDPDRLAEFPDCGGNLLRLGDGACDAYNNNEECGYDGGDCCLCTCIKNGECVFRGIRGFGCVDPSAEEGLYQCQPPPPHSAPCAVEIQRTWVVEDSTQARALAQAVNCSGGTFDVLWKGFVTVERDYLRRLRDSLDHYWSRGAIDRCNTWRPADANFDSDQCLTSRDQRELQLRFFGLWWCHRRVGVQHDLYTDVFRRQHGKWYGRCHLHGKSLHSLVRHGNKPST